MRQLLAAIDFRDPVRASRDFANLAQHVPDLVQKRIESLLASSPNPDVALHFLNSFGERQPDAFKRAASAGQRFPCSIRLIEVRMLVNSPLPGAEGPKAATKRVAR